MNLWSVSRIMKRLDNMLDNAIEGKTIETHFDETKMSALESKLAKYLKINQMGKNQLQAEKERIDELVSDISHQTKTPIANLLLYSELLEERICDEDTREMVNAIHFQAEKLSFLIQELVKTSRLEVGVIQTIPIENSIEKLITNCVNQVKVKALNKNIDIEKRLKNFKAFFDMKWTCEAICNILDNAVKYTNRNGKIEINVSEYTMFIRIDIKDSGVGISEKELPKVFQRFYKGSKTQQEEGIGLGLYLAREIIRSQGGYIKVKSELGKGTIFSIFLKNIS